MPIVTTVATNFTQDHKNDNAQEGETCFGPRGGGGPQGKHFLAQGILYVCSSNKPGFGSLIAMDAVDNTGVCTTFYLFIGSDGKLRITTSFTPPSNTNTDGTVVGSQS